MILGKHPLETASLQPGEQVHRPGSQILLTDCMVE